MIDNTMSDVNVSDVNVCCKINPALCATSYPGHWGYTIHVDYVTEW